MWSCCRRLCQHCSTLHCSRQQRRLCGSNDVFIASATRTPLGLAGGELTSVATPQLGTLALQMAMQQAAMPREELQEVLLAGNPLDGTEALRQATLAGLLPKSVSSAAVDYGLGAFVRGVKRIQGADGAILIASMHSATNNDIKALHKLPLSETEWRENSELLTAAWDRGVMEAEVTAVRLQAQRRAPTFVTRDEVGMRVCPQHRFDGASAVLLVTAATASRLHVKPLARVLACQQAATRPDLLIANLLECSGIATEQINRWEVDDRHFQLEGKRINIHGLDALAGIGTHTIVHLAHTLQAKQLGCIVATSNDISSAILLEKCATPNLGQHGEVPLFTLYTKDPCPLCDVFLEELAMHLPERYELEKVYISDKRNIRYLRAYRYDIPVLFLNGQFVCMHKLNVNLLKSLKVQT